MDSMIPLNDSEKVCNSCTMYIVLLVIFLIISISIGSAFTYFYWYLKKYIYFETTNYWIYEWLHSDKLI